jgi:hypothetical protein
MSSGAIPLSKLAIIVTFSLVENTEPVERVPRFSTFYFHGKSLSLRPYSIEKGSVLPNFVTPFTEKRGQESRLSIYRLWRLLDKKVSSRSAFSQAHISA